MQNPFPMVFASPCMTRAVPLAFLQSIGPDGAAFLWLIFKGGWKFFLSSQRLGAEKSLQEETCICPKCVVTWVRESLKSTSPEDLHFWSGYHDL